MQTIDTQVVASEVTSQDAQTVNLIAELLDFQLAFVGGGTGCVGFD
ncbi:hypothetical protein BH09PSE6_BH09PSE6_09770 [soil metagenome]